MKVTFYGVRGCVPAPGPGTVRYGGNTSCVAVGLDDGGLIILDCGTGARVLGRDLGDGPFGRGQGKATLLLSHSHWDHIQGFPLFQPFYAAGNEFDVYGHASSKAQMEQILEEQMSAQYFPVQTLHNMKAQLRLHAVNGAGAISLDGAQVKVRTNPHGATTALAFRIEAAGRTLVYASDADYGPALPADAIAFYQGADVLIHDCTFAPEDKIKDRTNALSSLDDAVAAARAASVGRLVLFHYHQDYSDNDVDRLVARGRAALSDETGIEVLAAAEGQSFVI